MGNCYVGQGIRLTLLTNIDLTSATGHVIKYVDPDGTTGQWTANLTSTPTDGKLYYDIISITKSGTWKLWAYVTIGGINYPGDPVSWVVKEEGEK